jgi:hypothetical protein
MLPVIMIILGFAWKRGGPKKINEVIGFRTKRSMASIESWRFAHIYYSKYSQKAGSILFILSLIVIFICIINNAIYETYIIAYYFSVSIQLAVMIIGIILTEIALRR